ncbi:MAG: GTP 3',8-cyclase MoaA [Eubacteriales bacterium]|nr:GTP 3',8-cyclase MoaA [Eubacteriales bacterium]
MKDSYGRTIDYMRISITDRCNLRCRYCMPEGIEVIPMEDLLTFEEIVEVCTQAALLGIKKLKVTGGEPLVRRGAPSLIGMLKKIPGIEDVTLTTNGVFLKKYLNELLENGLRSVNISLDTRDEKVYQSITGRDDFSMVMEGIEAAVGAGMKVKINTVLLEQCNAEEWPGMLELARKYPVDVRFIEIMPIGMGRNYRGVSNSELIKKLKEKYPSMKKDDRIHGNGPAKYYTIPGFLGSVGVISAMHGKFCDQCNRIRMSAQGEIKPCLCYGNAVDVRKVLRSYEKKDVQRKEALCRVLEEAIIKKPQAHCFEKREEITENKKMVSIGG